ncbi:MAG: Protease HtpX [Chroococcidiopsis cubana SAG 39.79]|uniref:Protease HtpX homolog n=1 Tax=Chroococcidiopsis cubana SAG 39.79 TaxID=388085 RepID=A0AB37UUT2_9CYAN|nr:zinc metalloprotease HtpX [Chroococcidiopsis cubana]MDZ4878070.1 Protease HtpX [Chroococcidiopsis cubana SAG 39.79]PSB66509.1 zinc metalloprotease HtpX [Chroococcidiopsis cubana CCALA 043]RUT14651.1 protease HtpX [Chroococcidiopsis cubana SAG 39.79]
MNALRTTFLMVLLVVLFVLVGRVLGGQSGMAIALILALAMNFFSYWFSDKLILKLYNAREIQQADAPRLWEIVAHLASRARLPMPKVYIIPSEQPNAFATGRNPKHAAVAVTTGIIEILDWKELEGVIGHELAHIKHNDILTGTIAATIAGAITYLAQMAYWLPIGRSDSRNGNPFVALLLLITAPIAAALIQMAISRSREFEADAGGAKISGNPLALANALRKLEAGARATPMNNATPATAHLFQVSPFSGRQGISNLFSTHPLTVERIRRLEAMAGRL